MRREELRPNQGLPDLDYSLHDRQVHVTACARICISGPDKTVGGCWGPQPPLWLPGSAPAAAAGAGTPEAFKFEVVF